MKKRTLRDARRQRVRSDESHHGDWRMKIRNPHEVEHLQMQPVHNLFHRTRAKTQYLRNVAVADYSYASDAVADWTPAHGLKRAVRLILALFVMLPLSVVMIYALLIQLYHAAPAMRDINFWLSEPVWFTLMGACLFASLKFSLVAENMLVYTYVLGHELTHAIAALISFGRVQSVHVDMSGGYVETDADNLFIALSPYFVPLWMLCWLGGLYVVNYFFPFAAYAPWFYAGLGFWWLFHLYWTVWIIPREQPDMLENGLVFSLLLIMLMNVGILLGILCCFDVLSFSGYLHDFTVCATNLLTMVRELSSWLWAVL